MIQASELRLNNEIGYGIYESGAMEFWKVKCIDRLRILVTNLSGDVFYITPEQAQPIPLTPEILEKCGFDKCDDVCGGWLAPENNDERLRIRRDEFGFFWQSEPSSVPVRIENLHQLQNFYFAHTGKELTINIAKTLPA